MASENMNGSKGRSGASSRSSLLVLLCVMVITLSLFACSLAQDVPKRRRVPLPLDRCMYACHGPFSDCYRNYTTSAEANLCIDTFNTCFQNCYRLY